MAQLFKVSFVPHDALQYNYIVEAKNKDDAHDQAKDQLRFDVGYDKAKDFECNNIIKEND